MPLRPAQAAGEEPRVEAAKPTPPPRWVPELPSAPGVTDLSFAELLAAGRGGAIDYTSKAKSLEGKTVRITGYMVRQGQPTPWVTLLSPTPQSLHEREYGLCDDLPISTIHILLPKGPKLFLPYNPGPVAVTGRLELGGREEADQRTSMARLVVASGTNDPVYVVSHYVQAPPAPVSPPASTAAR